MESLDNLSSRASAGHTALTLLLDKCRLTQYRNCALQPVQTRSTAIGCGLSAHLCHDLGDLAVPAPPMILLSLQELCGPTEPALPCSCVRRCFLLLPQMQQLCLLLLISGLGHCLESSQIRLIRQCGPSWTGSPCPCRSQLQAWPWVPGLICSTITSDSTEGLYWYTPRLEPSRQDIYDMLLGSTSSVELRDHVLVPCIMRGRRDREAALTSPFAAYGPTAVKVQPANTPMSHTHKPSFIHK